MSGYLDTLANLLGANKEAELVKQPETSFNNLGELQSSFQIFKKKFYRLQQLHSRRLLCKKERIISCRQNLPAATKSNFADAKETRAARPCLSGKTFAMNDTLMKQKVISALEYRNEQSKYVNKQQTIPQLTATIIANENGQNDKDKEIAELRNTTLQQKAIFYAGIKHIEK